MSQVWQGIIIGMCVSWPPMVASISVTLWLARRKVQQVADAQTADIKKVTEQQTKDLKVATLRSLELTGHHLPPKT